MDRERVDQRRIGGEWGGGRLMSRLAVAVTVCAAVLCAGGPAPAEGEREADVLGKLVDAERDTTYVATLITNESPGMPSRTAARRTKQKLWHGTNGKYRLEPIEPAELRGNIVIDDGRQAYHIFTRRKAYMVKPSAGSWVVGPMLRRIGAARKPEAQRMIREFVGRARIRITGDRRTMAGREAFALAFDAPPPGEGPPGGGPPPPERPDRPIPRSILWVDREKLVILGVETKGPEGRTVGRSEFESIDFGATVDPEKFSWKPGPDMQEVRPHRGRMTLDQASQHMGFRLGRPRLTDGLTIAGYMPEPGDAVEIVPFEPGGPGEGGPSLPIAVTRFHKIEREKRYVMELFQSSLRVLAHEIGDSGNLARKIRALRDGHWDAATHSYTWVLGEEDQLRLMRLQVPPEMTERKVREIARSVSF
jgi:hypothetical protein